MRYFLALCFLLTLAEVPAQNWKPVHREWNYLYYQDGHGFDSTAVTIQRNGYVQFGLDTLLWLNTSAHCISSSQNIYVVSQQNFLMKSIMLRNDGSFTCMTPDTFTFLPYNPVNVQWLFDTSAAVTAEITSEGQQTVFSTLDSVKTIMLSTGDSIVLSKNFGILAWPDNGTYFRLAGVTGANVGIQVPNVSSIFDAIQPGDVLEYHHITSNWQYPTSGIYNRTSWTYDSLVSKSTSNDTITLVFQRVHSDTTVYAVYGTFYGYDTVQWVAAYTDDSTNFLNYNASNLMVQRPEMGGYYQRIMFDSNQTFSCRAIVLEDKYYNGVFSPAVDTTTFTNGGNYGARFSVTYGEGVGLLYSYSRQAYSAYDHQEWDTLIYARIGNVSMGNIVALTGIEEPAQLQSGGLYPNPSSGDLTLPPWTQVGSVLTIYSSAGALCRQSAVESHKHIDVSDLSSGVYIIDFGNGVHMRFVKQ